MKDLRDQQLLQQLKEGWGHIFPRNVVQDVQLRKLEHTMAFLCFGSEYIESHINIYEQIQMLHLWYIELHLP